MHYGGEDEDGYPAPPRPGPSRMGSGSGAGRQKDLRDAGGDSHARYSSGLQANSSWTVSHRSISKNAGGPSFGKRSGPDNIKDSSKRAKVAYAPALGPYQRPALSFV